MPSPFAGVPPRAAAAPLPRPAVPWHRPPRAPLPVSRAVQPASTSKGKNDPTEEQPKLPGVYGIGKRLTRGQALGTTGGAQTTYLDASVNGSFFGKFTNKLDDHFPAQKGIKLMDPSEVQLLKLARWTGYPGHLATKPGEWSSDQVDEGAPHAEDLLIIALWTAYSTGGAAFFKSKGTLTPGKAPLLSIRINNSPCSRCAQNLLQVCNKIGLSLRVKASFHYEQDDVSDSGTKLLTNANVPVRHWRTGRIAVKTTGVASKGKRRLSGTEADWFKAARNDTAVAEDHWEDPYKRLHLDNSASISSFVGGSMDTSN